MPTRRSRPYCVHRNDHADVFFAGSEDVSVVPERSFAAAAAAVAANERSPTDQAAPAPDMATDLRVECIDKAPAKHGGSHSAVEYGIIVKIILIMQTLISLCCGD